MTLDTKHLTLAALLAVALFAGLYLLDSSRVTRAEAQASIADTKSALATQSNQVLQTQVTSQFASLQSQYDTLSRAIQTRQVTIQQVQATDSKLSPDSIASKWNSDLHIQSGVSITPTGYSVSPESALATLEALDSLPLTQATVSDLTVQLANRNSALELEKSSHTSDLTASQAVLSASQAALTVCKADARKGKLKWFGIGLAVGAVLRGFIP